MTWIVLGLALVAVMVLAVAYALLQLDGTLKTCRENIEAIALAKLEENNLIKSRNQMLRDIEVRNQKRHEERLQGLV